MNSPDLLVVALVASAGIGTLVLGTLLGLRAANKDYQQSRQQRRRITDKPA